MKNRIVRNARRTVVENLEGRTLFATGVVSGFIFLDRNGDGAFGTGEGKFGAGLWTVYLDKNSNGALDSGEPSTPNGTQGSYVFNGLATGNYKVSLVQRSGYTATIPSPAAKTVAVTDGKTTVQNFGQRFTALGGLIRGYLYNDANGNGAKDTGESPLAGWTVYTDTNKSGALDTGDLKSSVTDANGLYFFENMADGVYRIREVLQAGWSIVKPTLGYYDVTMASSAQIDNSFFNKQGTVVNTAKINGTLYNDANNNGALNTGEAGLASWTVYIDANQNGALDSGEKSTTTASNGTYSFTALAAGTYQVRSVLKTGYHFTAPAVGYQNVTLAAGATSAAINFLASNVVVTNNAKINGTFYNDANGNYKLDASEGTLASWTAYLDANNNGKLDTGEKTAVSAANGTYSFTGLAAGTYKVRAVSKAGYRITAPSTGYFNVTLAAGGTSSANNFLATTKARITGYVYNDANANGTKDSTEAGLANWRIYIDLNKNGQLDTGEVSILTSSTGYWAFEGISAATYTIRVIQQTGYQATIPTGGVGTFALAAAQTKSNVMFGEKKIV